MCVSVCVFVSEVDDVADESRAVANDNDDAEQQTTNNGSASASSSSSVMSITVSVTQFTRRDSR